MWLALLNALNSVPRILEAIERLGDIATVQMAQSRKDDKDKIVADLIAAAQQRRLSQREAERVRGDSSTESTGDGGRDSNGGGE